MILAIGPSERTSLLEELDTLLRQGKVCSVWRRLEASGLVENLDDPEMILLAGRCMRHAGGARRGTWHLRRGFRRFPDHPALRLERIRSLVARGWWWEADRWFAREPEPPAHAGKGVDVRDRASWLSLRAWLRARLRDLRGAEELAGRALLLCPDDGWLHVERADWLLEADRVAEAESAVEQALACWPDYFNATHLRARLLDMTGRREEALTSLAQAERATESMWPCMLTSDIQLDADRDDEAMAALDRAAERAVAATEQERQGFDVMRARVHVRAGRYDEAVELLRRCRLRGSATKYLEMLEQRPEQSRRLIHQVPFVRQDRWTCAPATVASLSAYLGHPIEHREMTEAVCHVGTPTHRERSWLTARGWKIRHFRVTWDATRQLLDAGFPFGMCTRDPDGAHAQAVVGYQEATGSVLVRDPGHHLLRDMHLLGYLKSRPLPPPLGTVYLPPGRHDAIADMDLPGEETADRIHAAQAALDQHQEVEAARVLAEPAPEQDQVEWLSARLSVVRSGRHLEALEIAERLHELLPETAAVIDLKAQLLSQAERSLEARALIAKALEQPLQHPVLLRRMAKLLFRDGGDLQHARALAIDGVRRSPSEGEAYSVLADMLWASSEREAALDAYRIAAQLAASYEPAAHTCFNAFRGLGCADEGIAWLEARVRDQRESTSAPAVTLAEALVSMSQLDAAEQVMERQLTQRPGDSDCLVELARLKTLNGGAEESRSLLERVAGRVNESWRLRIAAMTAEITGRWEEALEHTTALIERHHGDPELQAQRVRILGEHYGLSRLHTEAQALVGGQLEDAAAVGLCYQILVPRLSLGEREKAMRRVVALDARDAWAHRELAIILWQRQGKEDEVGSLLEAAHRLQPRQPGSLALLARHHRLAGQLKEAEALLVESLRLAPDFEAAWNEWLTCAPDAESRQRRVAEGLHRLRSVPVLGSEVAALLSEANMGVSEATAWLTTRLIGHPHDQEVHQLLVTYLLQSNDSEEALRAADRALQRFPSSQPLQEQRAKALTRLERHEEAVAVLERVLSVNPGLTSARQSLSQLLSTLDRDEEAHRCLLEGIAAEPLDEFAHGILAEHLWDRGERQQALEHMAVAADLQPRSQRAAEVLAGWIGSLPEEEAEPAVATARDHAQRYAAIPEAWTLLGDVLAARNLLDDARQAFESAVVLEDADDDARDKLAQTLIEMGQVDQARAWLDRWLDTDNPALNLRGRSVWLRWQTGERAEAISQMQALLEENPGYEWGLGQLLQWLDESQDHAAVVTWAQRMLELDPGSAVTRGFIADALLNIGDNDERAEQLLSEAVALSPSYLWARTRLADFLLEKGRHADALEVCGGAKIAPETPPDILARRLLALHGAQESDTMQQEMRDLLTASDYEPGQLGLVLSLLTDGGLAVLCLAQATALIATGELLNDRMVDIEMWARQSTFSKSHERLISAVEKTGRADPVVVELLIGAYGERGQLRKLKRLLRNSPEEMLSSTPSLWGMTGYGYCTLALWPKCIHWLCDYREREEVVPWMLWNLALAHGSLGQWQLMAKAHQAALDLESHHELLHDHRASLAALHALDGRLEEAQTHLARSDPSQLRPGDQMRHQIADSLLALHAADPAQRLQMMREQRPAILKLFIQTKSVAGSFEHRFFTRWCKAYKPLLPTLFSRLRDLIGI